MGVEPRQLKVSAFVAEYERTIRHSERRFCWLFGAGASKESGVPLAGEMAKEFVLELYRHEQPSATTVPEGWASEKTLGIKGFDPGDLAASYSPLYDKLYGHDPKVGYGYLQRKIEPASPSYGYGILAQILDRTDHRVVVTTNFDNLVAEALAALSEKTPLVIGHDALAGFVEIAPQRPVVVKLHNDVLLNPKNKPTETKRLSDEFCEALRKLFTLHSLIVVGYGGNDPSLMTELEGFDEGAIDQVYWCHVGEAPTDPRVVEFVRKQAGAFVQIPGFDALMLRLIEVHQRNWDGDAEDNPFGDPSARLMQLAQKRADLMTEQRERLELQSELESELSESAETKRLLKTMPWWDWEEKADAAKDDDSRKAIYEEAIQALPDSAPLLGNYANFLKTVRCENDRAEELYERAIEADPEDEYALGNFANFLADVRGEHDRAEELFERAIEADPMNANNLGNYGEFRLLRGEVEQGEALLDQIISDDPASSYEIGACMLLYLLGSDAGTPSRLSRIRNLLDQGARVATWTLTKPVTKAKDNGHPEAEWLEKLADVVNGKADPSTLDDWPAWQEAAQAGSDST